MENRIIRIIDSYNRKTLLEVEDGGRITVDGKPYQLHYLDETHFQINGECWHRDQFRVKVIDQGRVVIKVGASGQNDYTSKQENK